MYPKGGRQEVGVSKKEADRKSMCPKGGRSEAGVSKTEKDTSLKSLLGVWPVVVAG